MSFTAKTKGSLFSIIMIWVITTTLFTWLPLIRIIGRPEEYYWGILGLNGEGTNGPYWIFIFGTIFAIATIFCAFRCRKKVISYALIVLWQLLVLFIIGSALLESSTGSSIQGQGLDWEFPMWIISVPSVVCLLLTIILIGSKHTLEAKSKMSRWNQKNTKWLIASFILLLVGTVLFALGTNYNWVTSLAIIVTVTQWFFMAEAFKPKRK